MNGQVLEQAEKFKHLGYVITDEGECEAEVRMRIEIARNNLLKLRDVLTPKKYNLNLRKRLVPCYVTSTLRLRYMDAD